MHTALVIDIKKSTADNEKSTVVIVAPVGLSIPFSNSYFLDMPITVMSPSIGIR